MDLHTSIQVAALEIVPPLFNSDTLDPILVLTLVSDQPSRSILIFVLGC